MKYDMCALHRIGIWNYCALHNNGYNHSAELDSGRIMVYTISTIMIWRYTAMLKTPELAMPKSNTVITVYNGRREVWTDYYYSGTLNGEVLIDGKSVPDSPIFETAKKVGSVFQNPRSQFFQCQHHR